MLHLSKNDPGVPIPDHPNALEDGPEPHYEPKATVTTS
jgi:hypothetical protein